MRRIATPDIAAIYEMDVIVDAPGHPTFLLVTPEGGNPGVVFEVKSTTRKSTFLATPPEESPFPDRDALSPEAFLGHPRRQRYIAALTAIEQYDDVLAAHLDAQANWTLH